MRVCGSLLLYARVDSGIAGRRAFGVSLNLFAYYALSQAFCFLVLDISLAPEL